MENIRENALKNLSHHVKNSVEIYGGFNRLSDMTGVSADTLRRMSNKMNVEEESVIKLAEFLDQPVDSLYRTDNQRPFNREIIDRLITELSTEITRLMRHYE